MCGGRGGPEVPRSPEGIIEFLQRIRGHRPVPEWVFSFLEVLFKSRDQATFKNVRVRE